MSYWKGQVWATLYTKTLFCLSYHPSSNPTRKEEYMQPGVQGTKRKIPVTKKKKVIKRQSKTEETFSFLNLEIKMFMELLRLLHPKGR